VLAGTGHRHDGPGRAVRERCRARHGRGRAGWPASVVGRGGADGKRARLGGAEQGQAR
jgi:hypothetical protein